MAIPRISLVVPTLNRSSFLRGALDSFLGQDLDASTFEIIVVDNGSSDDTPSVVRHQLHEAQCAWRYVAEPRPGLHHARNRGILASRGDIVVFGDDDIVADSGWLSALLSEFDTSPETGVAGGPVLPLWQHEPPSWIYDYGSEAAHSVVACLNRGDARHELTHAHVIGCNLAIRREIAIRIGGSLPDTFPDRLRYLSGIGESGMIDNARKLGHRVAYVPAASVRHHVSASRMTLKYFVSRYRRLAVERAFDEFRTYGRWKGAARVSALTAIDLVRVPSEARLKRNQLYFVAIRLATTYESLVHIVRVLVRPRLYRHTRQATYLPDA